MTEFPLSGSGQNGATMTQEEYWSQLRRTVSESQSRMAGGPLYALMAGAGVVTCLSGIEGFLSFQPTHGLTSIQKLRFIVRYSTAQIIPSVIWGTQPPCVIAQAMGIPHPTALLYATPCQAPPKRHLRINRLVALRGAVAGSVILSQVLGLMGVLSSVQTDCIDRIRHGREPPLPDSTRKGVVVRMGGEHSAVSFLTMAREGRRKFFPIVENAKHPDNVSIVQQHAPASTTQGLPPRVPVLWQIPDGEYSHQASWSGMWVPASWLFSVESDDKKPRKKLLVLEADATRGDNTSMSLHRQGMDEMDLDLYEVAQGFTQLQKMVQHDGSSGWIQDQRKQQTEFDTLRVLLMDPEAIFVSGGGRKCTAREHAEELGLADVIIDARNPLIYSIVTWLEQYNQQYAKLRKKAIRGSKHPVILETPQKDWFLYIQEELKEHGYQVMDRADALDQYGSLEAIPFMVYERNTADTLHTVRQLLASNMASPNQMCALCPRPWMLEAIMGAKIDGVKYICSSDIHDRLFRWVRCQALKGRTAQEIQQALDTSMPEILQQVFAEE